jgi:hypothetical protein
VSPSGGVSAPRPLQGSAGAKGFTLFFLSHFITIMLLHPPQEAGESLCVAFEACIHGSEGEQVPHDHVGLIQLFFISK